MVCAVLYHLTLERSRFGRNRRDSFAYSVIPRIARPQIVSMWYSASTNSKAFMVKRRNERKTVSCKYTRPLEVTSQTFLEPPG